jgi:hypothetical protein
VNVPQLVSQGKDSFFESMRLQRMDSAGGNRGKMLWEVAKSSDVISPSEEEC